MPKYELPRTIEETRARYNQLADSPWSDPAERRALISHLRHLERDAVKSGDPYTPRAR